MPDITFRRAHADDNTRLEQIRVAAFAPIFRSFQEILGDTIYALAQAHEDKAQGPLLTEMLTDDSPWWVYAVEMDDVIVGFVSFCLDTEHAVGEIGLNAVDPEYAGKGIGTKMYQFALEQLKSAGARVATVSTGGDPSHQPALSAYRKAGFNVEISSVWLCKDL